jgi:hypothetical protein
VVALASAVITFNYCVLKLSIGYLIFYILDGSFFLKFLAGAARCLCRGKIKTIQNFVSKCYRNHLYSNTSGCVILFTGQAAVVAIRSSPSHHRFPGLPVHHARHELTINCKLDFIYFEVVNNFSIRVSEIEKFLLLRITSTIQRKLE